MTMSKRCVLAIAISVSIALLGCGGDDGAPATKPIVKETKNTPANETVRKKNPKRSAATPGGSVKRSQRGPHTQIIAELPENFPDDFPVYPQSEPEASLLSEGDDLVVSFSTDADPPAVMDYYKTALENRGWSVESEADLDVQGVLVTTKGQRTATVLVMAGPSGTHITLTIAAE